jgi:hypothetical protein
MVMDDAVLCMGIETVSLPFIHCVLGGFDQAIEFRVVAVSAVLFPLWDLPAPDSFVCSDHVENLGVGGNDDLDRFSF